MKSFYLDFCSFRVFTILLFDLLPFSRSILIIVSPPPQYPLLAQFCPLLLLLNLFPAVSLVLLMLFRSRKHLQFWLRPSARCWCWCWCWRGCPGSDPGQINRILSPRLTLLTDIAAEDLEPREETLLLSLSLSPFPLTVILLYLVHKVRQIFGEVVLDW